MGFKKRKSIDAPKSEKREINASILKGYDPTATAVSVKVNYRNSKKPTGIQQRTAYWYANKKYQDLIYTSYGYAYRWC